MSWPVYAEDEIAAVADVLSRGQGNAWSGPDVAAFEQAYAAHLACPMRWRWPMARWRWSWPSRGWG
nr:hypothetical protein [Bordetella hinzii]